MGLFVPSLEYGWVLTAATGRPGNSASFGVTGNPGNNSKGSWVELIDGALVDHDVWAIEVWINSVASSGAAKDYIFDIGIDPTAGTSYTVLIPDMLGSCAGVPGSNILGTRYFFPLHIAAGSSIAFRGSVNNASVGFARCNVILYGAPKHPELLWKGQVVEAIGITAASSSGTAVTSGSTSEGSWTSLGTVTRDARYWQAGFGINNATMSSAQYSMDLSAGASGGDRIIIYDQWVRTTTAEAAETHAPSHQGYCEVPAGTTVYGRLQCSTTPNTGLSMAAYAVS